MADLARPLGAAAQEGGGLPGQAIPVSPATPLGTLFAVFAGLGLRAWGGPAAQLAMIRDEATGRGWVASDRFNRLLAVYQALPGPEATEMCVHLGHLRRGRLGALLAGLGFLLPGLVLMLGLAWAYVALAADSPAALALLAGFPPAVAALVCAACIRLGAHALHDNSLALAALGVAAGTAAGVPFYLLLPLAGAFAALPRWRIPVGALALAVAAAWLLAAGPPAAAPPPTMAEPEGDVAQLGVAGLKAGLLTFGGAYTAVPFVREDTVGTHVTEGQFLDGLALAGILPAPFVIFATFVGFVGGGPWGSLAMTAGIFLPAFAFTLLGHRHLERLAAHRGLAGFLDGVTAGVIGILAVTALQLVATSLASGLGMALFLAALFPLISHARPWLTPAVVLGCGLLGAIVVGLGGTP